MPIITDVPIEIFQAKGVSAYNDDYVSLLKSTFGGRLRGRTLFVSTAVDRVTRSLKQFERLQAEVLRGEHAIMSFLWDHESLLRPEEALNISGQNAAGDLTPWTEALSEQVRAPLESLTLPLLQPVIWTSLSERALPYVLSLV